MGNDEITKYVNRKSAIARVFGNEALYNRMLKLFLSSEEFPKLDKALLAGDYLGAADVAHAIKGLTGNLSFDILFELSGRLTSELRRGTAPDPGLVADYREALDKTTEIVRGMLEA